MRIRTRPPSPPPFDFLQRAVAPPELRARIVNSGIPSHVPAREAKVLGRDLGLTSDRIAIETVESADGGT